MIILCFDQSSRISGYSVFETSPTKLLAHGLFSFDDSSLEQRLVKIRYEAMQLIEKYQPQKVYLEDIQYQTNINGGVTTYKALAEVIGVISELVVELGLPVELVHSQSWKSTCGIRGRSRADQKRNAQEHVLQTYGIKATQDICDAICIGEHVCSETQGAW